MKKLSSCFEGYKKQLVLGPAFKLAEAVMELFIPVIAADIIDTGIKNGDVNYIISRGLFMLFLGALGFLFALICQYCAAVCAFGFGRTLRRKLFLHITNLSQKEHSTLGTSTLITRLSNDATQVQTGINIAIRLAIRAPFLIIGSVLMSLYISVEIGLIFVVFTPIVLFIIYFIMKKSVPIFALIQKQQDNVSRIVGESLSGVRVIRAFSRQAAQKEEFTQQYDELTDTNIRVGKLSALLNPLVYALVNAAIIAILWLGGFYVNTGALEQGEIFALANYMIQTMLALFVLSNVVVICTRAIASAKRVEQILDIESSMQHVENSAKEELNAPCIQFKNVAYKYNEKSQEAVSDINFSLNKGETLGIIGGTGSGKSTIIRLLLRNYDVDGGSVFVDGVDVQNYTLKDLRAKMSVVEQYTRLFSGTVRSNLHVGKIDADDSELWAALSMSQGKEFVEKKDKKLDALVEEGAKNLSGGQKQRLSIARALIAKPQILILDDATSALDYATEAKLLKALRELGTGTTLVMVTQRAQSIKHADKILVLDDGIAVGIGTHAQLIKECEVYREICESQGIDGDEKAHSMAEAAVGKSKKSSDEEAVKNED